MIIKFIIQNQVIIFYLEDNLFILFSIIIFLQSYDSGKQYLIRIYLFIIQNHLYIISISILFYLQYLFMYLYDHIMQNIIIIIFILIIIILHYYFMAIILLYLILDLFYLQDYFINILINFLLLFIASIILIVIMYLAALVFQTYIYICKAK